MTITNGYCSLSNVLILLRIGSNNAPDDSAIEDMITETSRDIDRETGRRFYATTETRYFNTPRLATQLWFDDDLLSITTLTNGDGTVIAAANYKLYPLNTSPKYKLALLPSSSLYFTTNANGNDLGAVSLAGSWGYCATASVPADIRKACKEAVVSALRRRFGNNITEGSKITAAGTVITPSGWPSSVWDTVKRYKKTFDSTEPA